MIDSDKPEDTDIIIGRGTADVRPADRAEDGEGASGHPLPADDRARHGSIPESASARILYNSSTGALFYDADGNGAGAAVRFASVTPGTTLTFADIFIV